MNRQRVAEIKVLREPPAMCAGRDGAGGSRTKRRSNCSTEAPTALSARSCGSGTDHCIAESWCPS